MAELVVEDSGGASLAYGSAVNYLTAHNAAVGEATSFEAAPLPMLGQFYYGVDWQINRDALIFDTSALPDNATIASATLSLYGYDDHSDTNFDIVVVNGADIAVPPVDADYGDLLDDTVSRGSINTSVWALETYNAITLNATGTGEISKTGVTKFGLRSSRDISATDPKQNGGNWNEYVSFYGATANKNPKLTITYTVVAFIPKIFII